MPNLNSSSIVFPKISIGERLLCHIIFRKKYLSQFYQNENSRGQEISQQTCSEIETGYSKDILTKNHTTFFSQQYPFDFPDLLYQSSLHALLSNLNFLFQLQAELVDIQTESKLFKVYLGV